MRKIAALLFVLSLGFAYQFQGIDRVYGTWINTNPHTKGITKIVITRRGGNTYVKVWGKCHPTDCYWGEAKAYTFAGSPYDDPGRHFKSILAIYRFNESERYLIINRPSGNILRIRTMVRFPLDERKNMDKSYTFRKATVAPPAVRRVTEAPEPIYPPNGKVFHHYPRTTTLKWRPVPGAVSYTVEIYYIEPCGPMRRPETCRAVLWKKVEGIRGTSYTFRFVGAQPGKWRVWGVDASGRPGPKSRWMYFRYTR